MIDQQHPPGPRFGARTTAAFVLNKIDLSGKRAIIAAGDTERKDSALHGPRAVAIVPPLVSPL